MKKFIVFLTTILQFTCLFAWCTPKEENKDTKEKVTKEDEIRLLERINYNDGSYTEYKYDDKNRLAGVSSYDEKGNRLIEEGLEYEDDYLVGGSKVWGNDDDVAFSSAEYNNYDRNIIITNGGQRFGNDAVYRLNEHGIIMRTGYADYTTTIEVYKYDDNGNIIKITEIDDGDICKITEYEYDNKKSPYIHCNTPKWWLQFMNFPTKNNIIKTTKNGKVEEEYVYEYDEFGYPIKQTRNKGTKDETIEVYKYKIPVTPSGDSKK
jgi:hypothetical protein